MVATAPTVFFEFYKKVRISNCGIFVIQPTLNETDFNLKLEELGLNTPESYFTLNKLRSDEGMFNILSLFQMLSLRCPDYFPTVNTSEFSQIPYNAGDQTTFCSMDYNSKVNEINLLQHNSYPAGSPTLVNLIDILLIKPIFIEEGTENTLFTLGKPFSPLGLNKFNLGTCICDRALGILLNESHIDDTRTGGNETSDISTDLSKMRRKPRLFPALKWKHRNMQRELNSKELTSMRPNWEPKINVGIHEFNELSDKVNRIFGFLMGNRKDSPLTSL
jgi:hypothetical protein